MSAQTEAAVRRCPVEIWRLILRAATYVPPPIYHGIRHPYRSGRLFPLHLREGELVPCENTYILQRLQDAHNVTWSCVRVNRMWYDMCYPFLLEWMYILTMTTIPSPDLLRKGFQAGDRGQLVKSLHVIHQPNQPLPLFLQACTRLEEFTYMEYNTDAKSSRRLASYLTVLSTQCSQTLLRLDVRAKFKIPLDAICEILLACSKLQKLSCSAMAVDGFIPSPQFDGAQRTTIPLKSLSWAVDEAGIYHNQSMFFRFLSSLNMSSLHNLAVADFGPLYVNEAPESEPFLIDALRTYGPQLRYVQFEPRRSNRVDEPSNDVVCSILHSCPNISSLEFSPLMTMPLPSGAISHSLRELVCSTFFPLGQSAHHPDRVRDVVTRMSGVLQTFCTTQFPSLQVIRLMDLQKRTISSLNWSEKYKCEMPFESAQALEDLWNRCAERRLRLEDCTGELVDLRAFSPVEAWFYEFNEETFSFL